MKKNAYQIDVAEVFLQFPQQHRVQSALVAAAFVGEATLLEQPVENLCNIASTITQPNLNKKRPFKKLYVVQDKSYDKNKVCAYSGIRMTNAVFDTGN